MRGTIPFFLLATTSAIAQEATPYTIFTSKGKTSSYEKMVKEVSEADVVFFGEIHNNALNHWLELRLTKDLYSKHEGALSLGMEMFEADDQLVLDEYLTGLIEEKHLMSEAKVWDNYKTDYQPIVEFAKAKGLKVTATNIPRRYANLVYRKGPEALDGLTGQAKNWLPPLPFEADLTLPGYSEMIRSMAGHGSSGSAENLAMAQVSKDAAMAWFISKNLERYMLHFNGSFHSKNREGIIWHLEKYRPSLKISTIHCVEQQTNAELEPGNLGAADFIIVFPSDMAKTY